MKKFTAIFLLFCLLSCKSNYALDGDYEKVGSDFKYNIKLNKDSTFVLNQRYFEVNASCNGKWKMKNSTEILLQCAEPMEFEQLSSGYMRDRLISIKVLKNKKLKLDNIILRKLDN